jgi:hypothetical protein
MSQRDQRIDSQRAARWKIASEKSHTDEKNGDTRERQGIGRPYAVEQTPSSPTAAPAMA